VEWVVLAEDRDCCLSRIRYRYFSFPKMQRLYLSSDCERLHHVFNCKVILSNIRELKFVTRSACKGKGKVQQKAMANHSCTAELA
jgi:hypothetical protein